MLATSHPDKSFHGGPPLPGKPVSHPNRWCSQAGTTAPDCGTCTHTKRPSRLFFVTNGRVRGDSANGGVHIRSDVVMQFFILIRCGLSRATRQFSSIASEYPRGSQVDVSLKAVGDTLRNLIDEQPSSFARQSRHPRLETARNY
mgnify:CR=1 FL=1